MPTLNSADADIHYQILGDHGPVIVMIHGLLLGNMATWYFGAASLLSQNHRVIVYDLRGHGMSGKTPSGYDLKTMVEDLKALLDEQDIEKTSLVGHSYGALIGLEFAKAYPSRVERLSMVEGPLPPARGVQIDEFMKRNEDELMGMLPKQLQDALTSRQGKKLLERLMFLVGGTNLLENLQNEEDWDDAELQALGLPVQLIYGTSSQLVDVANRLQKNIPGADLCWLDGGHYLPSEKPIELGKALEGFFQS